MARGPLLMLWMYLLVLLTPSTTVWGQKYEGETCATGPDSFGECKRVSSCDSARVDIQNGRRPEICSYDRNVPIVCCADPSLVGSPVSSGPATQWPADVVATPRPTKRPTQRPTRRPTQRPTQEPTTLTLMTAASPSETTAPTRKPGRPQWWQIPQQKKTESPAIIDNLGTTPLSGIGSGQLPPRLQGTTDPAEPADVDRIIFNKNGR